MNPLTPKKLLAMPKSKYMSTVQLEFFKALLEAQLETTRETIRSARAQLTESQVVPDISDWATLEQDRNQALRLAERNEGLCKNIVSALNRIKSGDYGWCEETGEPIGLERLLSRPTAKLCYEAKVRQETIEQHTYKMRGAA